MRESSYLTLNPRQRLQAALRGGQPDVVPAAPCYPLLFLGDFFRANYREQYRRLLRTRSRCRIDHLQDTYFRVEALYQSYSIFKVRPDWMEVPAGTTRAWAERTDIVRDASRLYFEDRQSGARSPLDVITLYGDPDMSGQLPSLTDIHDNRVGYRSPAEIDAQVPIDPAEVLLKNGSWDLPALVTADYGSEYFIAAIAASPFSDAYNHLGFEGLMLSQQEQPELLHYLLERLLAQGREALTAWTATGIHGIFAEETFSGADMISPKNYDRFVFAYNARYFRQIRQAGLLSIHYVCGDVMPRLPRLLELEIDAVAVEESKKGFQLEIEDVIERVNGRCAVFGNIDAVKLGLNASLEAMAAETTRQVHAGTCAKGFVASTGSPFPHDTNPRLIDTLVSTAHSLPVRPASPRTQGIIATG
jgi:hypothetical protein